MIDRRERFNSLNELMLASQDGLQARLWTALPGIISSFNAAQGTVQVQPAVQGRVQNSDGSESWVNMPLLLDVPVVWQGGGGFVCTFPVSAGDECLVVFSSRCIDTWWQSGGHANKRPDLRMHDLSDGFAFVGPRSLVKAIANISTTSAQLRSESGAQYIELAPGGVINIHAPGGLNIVGNQNNTGIVVTTGAISSGGNITAAGNLGAGGTIVDGGGHSVGAHVHGGVVSGSSNTLPPTG